MLSTLNYPPLPNGFRHTSHGQISVRACDKAPLLYALKGPRGVGSPICDDPPPYDTISRTFFASSHVMTFPVLEFHNPMNQ